MSESKSYMGISPAEFEAKQTRRLPADTIGRERIENARARIDTSVPSAWRGAVVDAIQPDKNIFDAWDRDVDTLRRLREFERGHGGAIDWNLDDFEICKKAATLSDAVAELTSDIEAGGAARAVVLTEKQKMQAVELVCKIVGVDRPVAKTDGGAVARGLSVYWWRRCLRKKVARVVEHGAIKLGLVNKWRGGYASNEAVHRRTAQLKRNEATLKKSLIRNEAGQIFNLHELAKLSVANRDNRRGELMTRIRGCEEYADSVGHVSLFFTLTAPSKFHAYTFDKNGNLRANRHYNKLEGDNTECSPRGAQIWLRTMWARARAELHRKGVALYGFRVAEPHHDGTPHWHALFWFKSQEDAHAASDVIREMWLSEYGNENGADKHRVKVVAIDRTKGSAAGYIAKYITKNVGADFNIETAGHSTKTEYTYKRVDAWAATWGIRQFQAVGLPSVTVWRCLRGVDHAQANDARVNGDVTAWRAHGAVHRSGEVKACFMRFIDAMGGVCLGREAWSLQVAKRVHVAKNGYGETFDKKTAVGVKTAAGTWLISKRMAWTAYDKPQPIEGASEAVSVPESIEPLGSTWTRFNNCTARIRGVFRREVFGAPKLNFNPFEVFAPDIAVRMSG